MKNSQSNEKLTIKWKNLQSNVETHNPILKLTIQYWNSQSNEKLTIQWETHNKMKKLAIQCWNSQSNIETHSPIMKLIIQYLNSQSNEKLTIQWPKSEKKSHWPPGSCFHTGRWFRVLFVWKILIIFTNKILVHLQHPHHLHEQDHQHHHQHYYISYSWSTKNWCYCIFGRNRVGYLLRGAENMIGQAGPKNKTQYLEGFWAPLSHMVVWSKETHKSRSPV